MAIQMNRREKIGLAAAVAILLTVAVIEWGVTPLRTYADRLERNLSARTAALDEMHRLVTRHETLKAEAEAHRSRLARRQAGFTLFSFLDRAAGRTRIKDRIAYMKPSEETPKDSPYRISRVEMKIQAVTLPQLIAYLHQVETAPEAITVKRLSIAQTGDSEKRIDAVLQVETFES